MANSTVAHSLRRCCSSTSGHFATLPTSSRPLPQPSRHRQPMPAPAIGAARATGAKAAHAFSSAPTSSLAPLHLTSAQPASPFPSTRLDPGGGTTVRRILAGRRPLSFRTAAAAADGDGPGGDGETPSSPTPSPLSEEFRKKMEEMVARQGEDAQFDGVELARLIKQKYGRSYDVTLIKQDFLGKQLLSLNIMWKYREQKSFPLTQEEYLYRLDYVAENLRCWGAVELVRQSLAATKERPRIGKAVSIRIDMDESGERAREWIQR